MPEFIGRDITIEILLGKETRAKVGGVYPAPVIPAAYVFLGGTRGLDTTVEWSTIDSTSRSSKGNVRQSIVDYLAISGSTDGVWLTDDNENIESTNDYINNPPSGQPYGWVRLTRPAADGATITEELYALFTSFNMGGNYEDVGTFSMDYMGQQPVIKTLVPA